MAWLAESRSAVSLDRVQDHLSGTAGLDHDSVLVTIDDGYRSVHDTALPILKRHGIPAVLFVTVQGIGSDPSNQPDSGIVADERYLTWDELAGLEAAGVSVQSHAWTHSSLGRMSAAKVQEEAARSREILESRLGRAVTAFAYPFGTRADYTAATREVLDRCGYTLAFTSQHGAIRSGDDPLSLPRVKVEGGEGIRMFRSLAQGGLDGWAFVDRTLWRLQAAPHEADA